MKSPLKSFLLWVCLPFSALAADPTTPMIDIEPKLLNPPPQASQVVMPTEDTHATAMPGSASDDFAFVNKDPKGGGPVPRTESALPHLEGF
jgi:hypothetical protein